MGAGGLQTDAKLRSHRRGESGGCGRAGEDLRVPRCSLRWLEALTQALEIPATRLSEAPPEAGPCGRRAEAAWGSSSRKQTCRQGPHLLLGEKGPIQPGPAPRASPRLQPRAALPLPFPEPPVTLAAAWEGQA